MSLNFDTFKKFELQPASELGCPLKTNPFSPNEWIRTFQERQFVFAKIKIVLSKPDESFCPDRRIRSFHYVLAKQDISFFPNKRSSFFQARKHFVVSNQNNLVVPYASEHTWMRPNAFDWIRTDLKTSENSKTNDNLGRNLDTFNFELFIFAKIKSI